MCVECVFVACVVFFISVGRKYSDFCYILPYPAPPRPRQPGTTVGKYLVSSSFPTRPRVLYFVGTRVKTFLTDVANNNNKFDRRWRRRRCVRRMCRKLLVGLKSFEFCERIIYYYMAHDVFACERRWRKRLAIHYDI